MRPRAPPPPRVTVLTRAGPAEAGCHGPVPFIACGSRAPSRACERHAGRNLAPGPRLGCKARKVCEREREKHKTNKRYICALERACAPRPEARAPRPALRPPPWRRHVPPPPRRDAQFARALHGPSATPHSCRADLVCPQIWPNRPHIWPMRPEIGRIVPDVLSILPPISTAPAHVAGTTHSARQFCPPVLWHAGAERVSHRPSDRSVDPRPDRPSDIVTNRPTGSATTQFRGDREHHVGAVCSASSHCFGPSACRPGRGGGSWAGGERRFLRGPRCGALGPLALAHVGPQHPPKRPQFARTRATSSQRRARCGRSRSGKRTRRRHSPSEVGPVSLEGTKPTESSTRCSPSGGDARANAWSDLGRTRSAPSESPTH